MDLAFYIDSTDFVRSVLDRMLVSVARKRENLNQQSSTFDSRRISVLNSLSPFAPENLVSRDKFGRPVSRQPAPYSG